MTPANLIGGFLCKALGQLSRAHDVRKKNRHILGCHGHPPAAYTPHRRRPGAWLAGEQAGHMTEGKTVSADPSPLRPLGWLQNVGSVTHLGICGAIPG